MTHKRIETAGGGSPHVSREDLRYENLVQLECNFDNGRERPQKLGVI